MKEERIIEIYHRKKIANFGRIKQIQETQFTSVYKPILLWETNTMNNIT